MAVVAVWTMHVAMVVAVRMVVVMIAVRAVDMFLLGHALLLRDVIAGNYLAITRHVHALSEQPTRFNCAL
jgi:hypothetical protein